MQQRVDDRREKMESLLGRPHVQSQGELAHAQWTSRSFVSFHSFTHFFITKCSNPFNQYTFIFCPLCSGIKNSFIQLRLRSSWLHLKPCPPNYILHRVLLNTSYTMSSWLHLAPCPPEYIFHRVLLITDYIWNPVLLSPSDTLSSCLHLTYTLHTVPLPPSVTHTPWSLVYIWETLCFIVSALLLVTLNILWYCLSFSSFHLSTLHLTLSAPSAHLSVLSSTFCWPLSIQVLTSPPCLSPLSTFSFSCALVHKYFLP